MLVVGIPIAFGLSCRQIVGVSDSTPSELTTTACGLPYGTTTCSSCVSANCCTQSTECESDTACTEYLQCLGACTVGDWQCRSQCEVPHRFGGPALAPGVAPLTTCMAAKCASECGLTCGGAGAVWAAPNMASACESCVEGSPNMGCASALACASSLTCTGWSECIQGCATPDCATACGATFYDAGLGSTFLSPKDLKGLNGCTAQCGWGADWSCVGRVVWPGATNGATTLVADVVDWRTRQPIVGAQIDICGFTDQTCTRPVAEAGTGDGGVALLPLPALSNTSPLVGFGRSEDSFAQITSPAVIVPALYFLGYPVSTAAANIANPFVLVATPAEAQTGGGLLPPGANWDMTTKGWIGFGVYDCGRTPFPGAAGVQVTMDPPDSQARTYYFQGGIATNSMQTATDNSGIGGIINVTPGDVTLTATPLALGKPSSVGRVHVRAGTLSVLFMFPTPGTSQADK